MCLLKQRFILVYILLAFVCAKTSAQPPVTRTWTGAIDSDWHTAANWTGFQVPASNANVIIDTSQYVGDGHPIISASALSRSITLKNGGVLQINHDLQIFQGGIRIESGSSVLMNNGIVTNNSALRFKGENAALVISGGELNQYGNISDAGGGPNEGLVDIQISGDAIVRMYASLVLESGDLFRQTGFSYIYFNDVGTVSVEDGAILSLEGSGVHFSGSTIMTGSLTIKDVIIDNEKTLDYSSASTINIKGNWTNNGGTFEYGTSTVNFNGSGDQQINGSSTSQSFYNISVDKSGGTLSFDPTLTSLITNNITLTSVNTADVYAPNELHLTQSTTASLTFDTGNTGVLHADSLITIRGNWMNNCDENIFNPANGLVKFVQGAVQLIDGTTASHKFYNLETHKSAQSLALSGNATQLTVNNFTQTAFRFNASALSAFYVNGNFTHTSGTFNPCNTIYITGNIIDNHPHGGLVWGNSVTLNGSAAQIIGGAYPTRFKTLEINNLDTIGITLQQPVFIDVSLVLTTGYIHTDYTNLLVIQDNAISSLGSEASFVDGPIKKIGDEPFLFPVGFEGRYAPLEIIDDGSFQNFNPTTQFTCIYHAHAPPNNTNPEALEASIKYASNAEHWDLDRTYDPDNNAQCNVRLYFTDTSFSGIKSNQLADVQFVHLSSESGMYENHGGEVVLLGGWGYITSAIPLRDFSPMTFGSGGGFNPLPVELLSINATATTNNKVELVWEVASEINNDYYTIERSINGVDFYPIAIVKGAGTTFQPLTYSVIDHSPLIGISYYRLRQTDFDGANKLYRTVHIELNDDREEYVFYPNPLYPHNELMLRINSSADKYIEVNIIDSNGKNTCSKSVFLKKGFNQVSVKSIACNLSTGIYFVLVTNNNKTHSTKLVVR